MIDWFTDSLIHWLLSLVIFLINFKGLNTFLRCTPINPFSYNFQPSFPFSFSFFHYFYTVAPSIKRIALQGPCQTLKPYLKKKLSKTFMYIYNIKLIRKINRVRLRIFLFCSILQSSNYLLFVCLKLIVLEFEHGFNENPLKISWLQGNKSSNNEKKRKFSDTTPSSEDAKHSEVTFVDSFFFNWDIVMNLSYSWSKATFSHYLN